MTDSDKSVYIRNTFTNEYLLATEQTRLIDSGSKMTSLASTPQGSEFEWILEYHDIRFNIINSRNCRYLSLFCPYSDNPNNLFVTTYHVSI